MTKLRHDPSAYLSSTIFIDHDHPAVAAFAEEVAGDEASDTAKAVALYEAVRDRIRYDPYRVDLTAAAQRASATLTRGFGFCVSKAVLLAAVARAQGIASRLGFADVKNHLATERLLRLLKTDLFVFHGYTELFLAGRWVKATPAFNASLCERFNVAPLPFDGVHDSIFQEFDREGNKYMEYVTDRGQHADLPLDEMVAAFQEHYPSVMQGSRYDLTGDFVSDHRQDVAAS